ncbi:hypothetical protein L486_07749 [Kwoniella mangroviensis CBS 10435]|uniref:Uncharacterized protein n=1 Tax=Kwoniella mangroviensis CBS 10435 TaxID=1331196 RepID=A0A1B9IGS8_9TREE|nr:uncharacterized protein I203_07052 [Kwoniella mangroviensis CBS 8507]OCF54617.1 hypothetical protein L486_07749 [Kwoniella mangroviensis CBS 10435]OCF63733.1 hypothetical protein I203_07052 [Kwoniella mangroviensis CBS 8507]OCF78756.1 hypothetical protein I204_00700 [Kwoniella mangroviensis CBS 8886]
MPEQQTSISQDTAQGMTAQAGGLENAAGQIERLRQRAEAAGLDPDEHINTSQRYIALSSQLAEVLQASSQSQENNNQ